jgi:Holliday junction resolvasome RuvABC ATP-dependent DNA helicase subunit
MTQIYDVDLSSEIIGQDTLVGQCQLLLAEARRHSGPNGHLALGSPITVAGPAGSGRTHIALTLGRALGGDCLTINARHVKSMADLRLELHDRIPGASSAVVVVEHADQAPPAFLRGLDKAARQARIATTKGREIAPFSVLAICLRDVVLRDWMTLRVEPYDRDAVAKIIRNHYGWHLEVRRLVALAGRLRPTLALRRAKELETLAGTPRATERHAAFAMENWGLDRLGLDEVDRKVMAALANGEAASLSQLGDRVAVRSARLADLVLPYLAELGLLKELESAQWQATRAGLDVYGDAQ